LYLVRLVLLLLGSSGKCRSVYPRTISLGPGCAGRAFRASPRAAVRLGHSASILPSLRSAALCALRLPSCALRARERATCACSGKFGGKKPPPNFSAPGSGGASSRHPRVLAARLKQAVAPACGGRYAPASRAPSPGPFGLRPRLRPLSVTPSCNAVKPRQNPGDSSFPRKPRRPPGGRLRGRSKVK